MNKVSFSHSLKAGAFAGLTSIAINSALFYALHSNGTFSDDIFVQPNEPLTILPVIISSLLPALLASMVFFLFEKYTQNGFKIFSIVAVVLGLLSLGSPFSIPNVTTGFAVGLDVMHVVVVSALLFFLGQAVKASK